MGKTCFFGGREAQQTNACRKHARQHQLSKIEVDELNEGEVAQKHEVLRETEVTLDESGRVLVTSDMDCPAP